MLFLVAPHRHASLLDSWATSVLVGLNMYRAGGTDWVKNIVPKQWTVSGFVQHTMQCYLNVQRRLVSNKKYCIWINAWTCATFSNEFQRRNPTTVLMAKSPRDHTLCTPLSIYQLYIFGIFEHKWGTRKHLDDLKKYSWCIPVQKKIKPIIWRAAITPEPSNRQQW